MAPSVPVECVESPAADRDCFWRGFLPADERSALERLLSPAGVDAIELAAVQHFISPTQGELAQIGAMADEFRELQATAAALSDRLASLSGWARACLQNQFHRTEVGRILFGSPEQLLHLQRHFFAKRSPHHWSWQVLASFAEGIESSAAHMASVTAARVGRDSKGPGRPASQHWVVLAAVAAVCLEHGESASEHSVTFMQAAGAVWRGAGIGKEPIHAVRTMRRELHKRVAGGGRYEIHLPELGRCYVVTAAGRNSLAAVRQSSEW